MTYIDTKKLTKDMYTAFGRSCIRRGISCTPNYYNLNHRIEADIICVDNDMLIHEVEIKSTYCGFLQEKVKGGKYPLMVAGKLDCNTFSYLVPFDIHQKVMDNSSSLFGVYCLIYDKNGRKRIECKRKPQFISKRKRSAKVIHNILKKTTVKIWS